MSISDEEGDIIQIGPDHKWAFCLAVVSEVKSFGVQAYVRMPSNNEDSAGNVYIRLNRDDYERVGAKVLWAPAS